MRTFVLLSDGRINYYKDKALFRGFIKLSPDTKVVKTAKDKFEVVTTHRTYYLSETETNRLCIDTWIEMIREAITNLN